MQTRGIAQLRRAVGAVSRRLDRPELLAAVNPAARRAEHEAVAASAVLAAVLRADSTYVDIGANRGQVLKEALRVAPGARHIAFEPIPSLAAELARELPGVDCRQMALGASPGRAEFCHYRALDGWSGLRRNPEISDERGQPELIDVQISTLDAELADTRPTVIKIDVEGAELAVLEGGRGLLVRERPLVIFEHVASAAEVYGASSEDLWKLLSDLDYVIFSATGAGPFAHPEPATGEGIINWLAVPRLGARVQSSSS